MSYKSQAAATTASKSSGSAPAVLFSKPANYKMNKDEGKQLQPERPRT